MGEILQKNLILSDQFQVQAVLLVFFCISSG